MTILDTAGVVAVSIHDSRTDPAVVFSGREEIRHVAGKTYRIDSGADESEGVTLGVEQRVDDLRELAGGEEPSHGRPANYDYEKLPTRRALDHLDHPPEQRTRATAHGMRADRR